MAEIKLARCVCGREARMRGATGAYFVGCTSGGMDGHWCWEGPDRKTQRGAAAAWNRVMERKEAKRG